MEKLILVLLTLFIIFGVIQFAVVGTEKKRQKERRRKRKKSQEAKTGRAEPEITVEISTGDADDDYFCKIAGTKFSCAHSDIGGFIGWVAPEPENQYDKNAVAIYRNDGKRLGYIPADELSEFCAWSKRKSLPCVGFIKTGSSDILFGKVKVVNRAEDEEIELQVIKFVRWMVANLGEKYLPVGFEINTDKPMRTKQDILDVLDENISEKENQLFEEIEDTEND